jgi:hypothetical protein
MKYEPRIKLKYIPYIFDDREAWEKTIVDEDYNHDMPFKEFQNIYKKYRNQFKGSVPL